MRSEELKQNVTVYGPLFPEPVQIIIAIPMGSSVKLIGKGVRSSTVYEPILSAEQLAQLHASPAQEPFDGDASKFRLGVEAMRRYRGLLCRSIGQGPSGASHCVDRRFHRGQRCPDSYLSSNTSTGRQEGIGADTTAERNDAHATVGQTYFQDTPFLPRSYHLELKMFWQPMANERRNVYHAVNG